MQRENDALHALAVYFRLSEFRTAQQYVGLENLITRAPRTGCGVLFVRIRSTQPGVRTSKSYVIIYAWAV